MSGVMWTMSLPTEITLYMSRSKTVTVLAFNNHTVENQKVDDILGFKNLPIRALKQQMLYAA